MNKTPSLALLLGAGFSKWAADFPLASELFDFSIDPFGPREAKHLDFLYKKKQSWDKSNKTSLAVDFIADSINASEKLRKVTVWYIARRLSEPYIWHEVHAGKRRRHVLMFDEKRKLDRPGVTKTQNFFSPLIPYLSGILTSNYDLLPEYALGTRHFNYGSVGEILAGRGPYPVSQWLNPVTLRDNIPLAKLHGSLSWDGNRRYTDGRRGIAGEALIIAPVPEKAQPDELAEAWTLGASVLKNSTSILVFGFAFNPYDEALLSLLKDSGRKIEKVVLVNPSDLTERAQAVFPSAAVYSLSPSEGSSPSATWLATLFDCIAG